MVRTVISLGAADKSWLDEKSREEGVPMTELVRRAITRYRQVDAAASPKGVRAALAATRGLWNKGDGLAYQRRVRSEWARK
jgi:hypothetical protein